MTGTKRITHISFPDMPSSYQDITSGIADGSLLLDEVLLSEGINFGEINSNKFEVQIYNIEDVSGQRIRVWQTIEDEEDTTNAPEEVPIFCGVVDSSKKNSSGYYRDIVAYDVFYTKGNDDISSWWKNLWETYPDGRTIKQLRQALLSKMGFTEAYPEYPYINDSVLIHRLPDEATLTFSVLIKMICELQGTIPNVDREGNIDFVELANGSVDVSDNLDTHNSLFEEFQTEFIDAVWVYDLDDNLIETGGSGVDNPYKVQGNLLVKGIENIKSVAENLYNKVKHMSYTPGNIRYIVSDLGIYLGWSVSFENTHSYVFENILSGPLMVEQETVSKGGILLEKQSNYNSGIASIRSKESSDQTQYFMISNTEAIAIADGENKRIIDARFTSNSKTIAIFHAEILLDCVTTSGTETIEGETYDVYNDDDILITYVYNQETITHYKPKEVYTDGDHILHLLYYIPIEEARLERFEVWLESSGGRLLIPASGINASIYGQNIVGKDDFSGLIEVSDEFSQFDFDDLMGEFTDSATITLYIPHVATAADNIQVMTFDDMIGTFIDSVEFVKDMIEMYYGDGLTDDENCGVSGTTWVGPGYLISTDVYNTDHIIANATTGVEYQISYDDGETWLGFLNGEWVEGITMTKSQLEAITQSDWTHYPMKLKAILSSGARVSSIIFVNGNVVVQNGG